MVAPPGWMRRRDRDIGSASGVTLAAGTGTLSVRSIDTAGNTTPGTGHSYTLQTTGPSAIATVTALSADRHAGDFITSVAAQTVSGTFTGTLAAGEKIQVSANGGTTWWMRRRDRGHHGRRAG